MKIEKIYSRPRIRLPKIFVSKTYINSRVSKIDNKRQKKFFEILCILVIAFVTVKLFFDITNPIFNIQCENEAKAIATIISNEQSTFVMKEHCYDDLFTIEKDNSGNIIMIKSNSIVINEIISDVSRNIQSELNKKDRQKKEIALRYFYGC